jgi:hypothetical protein
MFHLNKDKTTAVSDDVYWQPILTCPKNVKVQLLTKGRVAVYGMIRYHFEESNYKFWAPLPRVPEPDYAEP